MVAATVDGLRVVSLYAPNGRVVGSPFYEGKLAWFARLARWVGEQGDTADLVLGGDLNVAPTDIDVWDAAAVHGGTHVSEPERDGFRALLDLGLVDGYRAVHSEAGRFSWWDYRAGMFHKNLGMRIDHLLLGPAVAPRIVDAEIDRDARKGPPVPSDHAPLLVDLDEPGRPIDPDWEGALQAHQGADAVRPGRVRPGTWWSGRSIPDASRSCYRTDRPVARPGRHPPRPIERRAQGPARQFGGATMAGDHRRRGRRHG